MYTVIVFLMYHFFLFQLLNYSSSSSSLRQHHLATKTPYRFIENKDVARLHFAGCEPQKIWMVIRHGTRLPSKKFINAMKTRLPKIRDEIIKNSKTNKIKLSSDELKNIRNWKISIQEIDEKILAHEGENEMIELAERMHFRLPDILPEIYSNTSYKFKYTASQRTQQSAHYFATGLFGRNTARDVWYPRALHQDPILRFYKACDKWKKQIKNNPDTVKEHNLFKNGTTVNKTCKSVSSKLGFTKVLHYDDLHLMYMTCAFETSWTKKDKSPWCAVFSEETIKVLEYAEDLKYYWVDGPGFKLTSKIACPAVKNLADYFSDENIYPKATLYFTHSGTILKLLTHLRIYNEQEPLRHDNYEQLSNRLWNVSKIDTFASNIAAVLFRCGSTKKVLFLHQERIIKLPGCSKELCDFNTFLNIFNDSINNCKFAEMCNV